MLIENTLSKLQEMKLTMMAKAFREQLTDTNQTRTIYRNSDGQPLVITPDANGNWVDSSGNTYEFVNNEDVYDQDGVDYYWHGEGADVYYMPVE